MKTLHTVILSVILLSLAASCSRRHRAVHREIDRISAIADVDPYSALRLLDSMAPTLAADDNLLMHHRLILVKARDKADMPFTTDSLIRPVIDYYRDRGPSDTLLPLALYYGGRAYSELGDAPRALDYFRQALAVLPDSVNPRLRGYIHAQSAGIYYRQNMLDRALAENKKALAISTSLHDTIAMGYDLKDIAYDYMCLGFPDSAMHFLDLAFELSATGTPEWQNFMRGQMASHYYMTGNIQKADSLIRNTLQDTISLPFKDSIYTIATDIFISEEDYTSVAPYLNWLSDSGSVYAKRNAARCLALIEARKSSSDSIHVYINDLLKYTDSIVMVENADAVIRMNAVYDYSVRERENQELKNHALTIERNLSIASTLAVVLILICLFSIRKMRTNKKELENLNLKFRLLQEKNADNSTSRFSSDQALKNDAAAINFIEKINHSQYKFNEVEWEALINAFVTHSPQFSYIFFQNRILSVTEQRISMLTKLNVPNKTIAKILYKSESTISSAKSRLYKKLKNTTTASAADLNNLIGSL